MISSPVVSFRNPDLHNHSTASDGTLAPAALVSLAAKNGCDALALTDHDTTAGLAEAESAASIHNITLIRGVEISVSWRPRNDEDAKFTTLHIVGLNIDPEAAPLRDGLQTIRSGRLERGKLIDRSLAEAGVHDTLPAALAFAENKEMLGRTHFARVLVERKLVPDVNRAFNKFLTPGKPGFVPHRWATLGEAVSWIHAAGGVAVIAHPGRYRLHSADVERLFTEFKELGGAAIEVVTGSHTPKQYAEFAHLARTFGFSASRGSDFHDLEESSFAPGTTPPLLPDLAPVWNQLH